MRKKAQNVLGRVAVLGLAAYFPTDWARLTRISVRSSVRFTEGW
jgi:hypothetical protein